MANIIDIQKRLVPDLLDEIQLKYQVLRSVRFLQPVGRRSLAQSLGMTERVLRKEVEQLKAQDLLHIHSSGMSLTKDGLEILIPLERMINEISGITLMEHSLKEMLKVKEVMIVPGDSDDSPWVKEELGRAAIQSMKPYVGTDTVIAVTGGTTMSAVAGMLTPDFATPETLFVPARGGIGEDVQNQANTICSTMALKSGARHRVLYVPDQVSREVYESIMKEPAIKEVMSLITSADIVLHGIGDAFTMAKRRSTTEEHFQTISSGQAVGEAFGYYFDVEGNIVHKVKTIGLQLKDLSNVPNVFAVAGGHSKAQAIRAYFKGAPETSSTLITDEGAAKELLKG
ncbi:sugar-binding transcriptional regulator [Jeotgalibacillus haloalkalitolerans]|uniref:Sugar-binding domain-containing protein n=1 Tax=Jeotgalibacillus haloalkalitolerans TaxID=3104292 RepID=A0ABU5KQT9_9BACL|nr:sugar-binding domain-containing protein [Jeotgalibacillus sp. HH7-29]MDZ5713534.1 sugar-binding domain-containing protein [Jeotgalibacillus sp. HH7-29]